MTREVVKPLLRSGVLYIGEVAKCTAAGMVVSGAVCWVLMSRLPPASQGPRFLALAGFAAFLVLFGIAGHQRGIVRMLGNLTHSHGGLLFDQTLGRFVHMAESRRLGAVASMLSAPGKLAAGFREYLQNEGSAIPRTVRRLGEYYVNKFDDRIMQAGGLPADAVVAGQLQQDVLKGWTVQQMRERFQPSWALFGIFASAEAALAVALWWATR